MNIGERIIKGNHYIIGVPMKVNMRNELHTMLLAGTNHISISELAKKIGVSGQAVYLWIRRNKIPPEHILKIIKLSKGHLGMEELTPYVFGTPITTKKTFSIERIGY